jgi:hypothetical protein
MVGAARTGIYVQDLCRSLRCSPAARQPLVVSPQSTIAGSLLRVGWIAARRQSAA